MRDVYIIGVGQSRFGKYPDSTVPVMAEKAISLALLDSGLGRKSIESVFFANTHGDWFAGQHSDRGQVVMQAIGFDGVSVVNVENACAGGATALNMAYTSVREGVYDLVAVLGVEKMTRPGKVNPSTACSDSENNTGGRKGEGVADIGLSFSVDSCARLAASHIERYGTTREQLARIASKNHFHGSLNPRSQDQKPISVEAVLADETVVPPFTRSMCTPTGDGAAAVVVCSGQVLKKLGDVRPIKILASVLEQGSDHDMDDEKLVVQLASKGYETAGLKPENIDVAEVHDFTAFGELRQTEFLGFCSKGEGGNLVESGATTLGGRIPINTSGGLESRGYPIAASGLAQVHEIVTQLRGEAGKRQVAGATIGIFQSWGEHKTGEESVVCLHILQGK
jgi:acetyl-CoA acyltransferase